MTVFYVHGKGGSASESRHYEPLFPDSRVIGLNYRSSLPWEAGTEIRQAVQSLKSEGDSVTLIANSIGAFFCFHAGIDRLLEKAFLISPIIDMEQLILSMMKHAGITEQALQDKSQIVLPNGETLLWRYLLFVRSQPISWHTSTEILFGRNDTMTSLETIRSFAVKTGAHLTVMENGEHWFHTEKQMQFLDRWITAGQGRKQQE